MIALNDLIHNNFKIIEAGNSIEKEMLLKKVLSRSQEIQKEAKSSFSLMCAPDFTNFIVDFLAALMLEKTIVIPHNLKEETIKEVAEKLNSEKNQSGLPLNLSYEIYLTTSGSTQEPKIIKKTLKNLIDEVHYLEEHFSTKDLEIKSTVSHVHIYGLLYKFLWPLIHGRTVHAENIENSYQLSQSNPCCLITSPAFLKRLDNEVIYSKNIRFLFSSGGLLTEASYLKASKHFKTIVEIYGSTETGGIASRDQAINTLWSPFKNLSIHKLGSEAILNSPFINQKDYHLDDDLTFIDDAHFELHGRQDNTVKIEEKRVNIKQIENTLLELDEVSDCHALKVETATRQTIEILVVENLKTTFSNLSEKEKNIFLRSHLRKYYDDILIPKLFTFVEKIPYNGQSKISKKEVYEIISKRNTI